MATPKIKLTGDAPVSLNVDVLAVPVFQGELDGGPAGREALAALFDAFDGALPGLLKEERFEGKAGQKLLLHTHGKVSAPRLLLVGLGTEGDDAHNALRDAAAVAARVTRQAAFQKVAVVVPVPLDDDAGIRAASEGVVLGNYRFDKYLSDEAEKARKPLKEVTLVTGGNARSLRGAITLGTAIAEAVNFARDLVNEPAGVIYPESLAEAAKSLGKDHDLKVTVKGAKEIERLKMGMFTAVGQGSDHEPKLIQIDYKPTGKSKGKGIAFVGKGVTFDAGGYDLKPGPFMEDMKMDMAGAAAAIAVMKAVAAIKPPFPVTAYAGAAENLISGRAFKPGDVLTSRKGKTVEINNTDAEGRLVLGDVLTYASEKGYDTIIDLATLTGACVVALGPYTYGCLSPDDALAEEILTAADQAGEDVWRMPLNEDLREQLKSDVADMKNTGERYGGTITAGLFLKEFVDEKISWAHLDIAGPAMIKSERGANGKGATGVAVRTLAQLLLTRAGK